MKQSKVNSLTCHDSPDIWPEAVWDLFERRLAKIINSNGLPYYTSAQLLSNIENGPPLLHNEQCHIPYGPNMIMVCYQHRQYQRPIHRIRFLLDLRGKIITSADRIRIQASHLCCDEINMDGKGSKHCSNPNHMVPEDDKTNKSRQRCAGWIYVRPFQGKPGNFWYPTCVHDPPCLRYTPSTQVPSYIAKQLT